MKVVGLLRWIAIRATWVVVALLIALGGAGIVATINHAPGTEARAELTWAGDTEAEPELDEATVELEALADEVDQLATTGRRALSQVTAGDTEGLQDTITDGTVRLGRVEGQASTLEAALAGIPHRGEDWALFVSGDLHQRYLELAATSGLTAGLEDDWAAFTSRSLNAAHLGRLLVRHDEETAAAAAEGTKGHFTEALAALDASDATIAEARGLRDRLAATTDVATLTAWLDRNAAYDVALRGLYAALLESDARVTAEVRKAFDAEKAARAQLPGDTRGLVVIMADIAQGGLNQAVIAIEEARGSLAEAIEVQQRLREGESIVPPG